MAILKVSDKKGSPEKTKLVGAHLPQQVSDYLMLYSLAHGISKTVIVRDEVQHWYDSQMEKAEELVKMIGTKARTEQKKWESKMTFKKNLRSELIRRNVNDDYIKTILTMLE